MASAYSNVSPIGLKRFRRWYQQYRATHGTPPPQHMMSSFLQADMESQMARADRGRLIGLEERKLSESTRLAERRLGLSEEAMKRESRAAMVSGVGQLAIGGVLAKKAFAKEGTTAGAGGAAAGPSLTVTAPAAGAATMAAIPAATGTGGAGIGAAGIEVADIGGVGAGATEAGMGGAAGIGPIEGTASGGMAGAAKLAMPYLATAGAGFVGGQIGAQVFSGEPKLGGTATGAASGVGMAMLFGLNPVVGGFVGAVTGFFGGGGCIIVTAATNLNSPEVDIARVLRDKYLHEDTLRGYYMLAETIVPMMLISPWLRENIKQDFVDPLGLYPRYSSIGGLTLGEFLSLCNELGGGHQQYQRWNGEVV